MFGPIDTARLTLRNYEPGDAAGLWRRRNDPEVARYQDWLTPYEATAAQRMVDECRRLGGPTADEWWNAAIVERASGSVIGDLAVGMSHGLRTAEVGYTLERPAWGRGYAAEALGALLEHLWRDVGITRAEGRLHPDNVASAMVLERSGFVFEGHTRLSYWLGDECSDDWIYGQARGDWEQWRDRRRGPPAPVALAELTADDVAAVRALRTHRSQHRFVAPVEASLADALLPVAIDPTAAVPWLRAVVADGEIVGLAIAAPETPVARLTCLLIDRLHQRRGIGRRALATVLDELAASGATTVATAWVNGKGSPEPFLLAAGFEPVGVDADGRVIARRAL